MSIGLDRAYLLKIFKFLSGQLLIEYYDRKIKEKRTLKELHISKLGNIGESVFRTDGTLDFSAFDKLKREGNKDLRLAEILRTEEKNF